ncbi:MAG: acetyl-CoA carboxylase, biotin carboxyl carrier protein [Acidobacteria bacterium RIFCSPLOWO2_02_FULL_59_13]|nr:MAG: acetyl-CoA carboxylase, biotin carboxyl carrier protein [Acidobacteria bacterium RIFCSPLOWO2_02_FULL_59_13]
MNLKEIKDLIDLITEKGISEFELERSGVRLKISRNAVSGSHPVQLQPANVHPPASVVNSPAIASHSETAALPVAAAQVAAPASAEEVYVVRSPMVGTFFSAPAEGEPLCVQVGDKIQPGKVLCIIEAMKLMNEIEAEIAGEVIRCHVENGQPVEYGEPLFDLRPLASPKKRA